MDETKPTYEELKDKLSKQLKMQAGLRYQAEIARNISDAVISSDTHHNILSWNKGAEEMYGWLESEVLGKQIGEVTKPLHYIPIEENSDLLIKSGYWKGEAIHHRKNGEAFNVFISISLMRDEEGRETGAVAVFRDISDLKKAEEALKESEDKYRNIVEQALVGIGLTRREEIVFANKALLKILKYDSLEEYLKVPMMEQVAPHSREIILKRIEQVNKGIIPPAVFEYDGLCKDGTIKNLQVSSTFITLKGEIYNQTIFQDVTEQKKARQALKASEERYRSSLDNMMEGCQIIDRDWRYIYVNESCVKQSHVTKDELIGRRLLEVYPEVESTEMYAAMKRCMYEGVSCRMEVETTYWAGHPEWFDLSMQAVPEGIFMLSLNITERRKAEIAIHESEERFRGIFQAAPLGIALAGMDFRFTMVNARFCEMHGYTEQELHGMTFKDFITPDDESELDGFQKLMEKEIPYFSIEKVARKKNGKEFWVSVTVAVIRGDEDKPQALLSMVQDITSRKEDEERINHLNRALRSIRNINQLITREKNREQLIQGVCDNLVLSRSFHSAYIILVDEARKPVTWAGTSISRGMESIIEEMKAGKYPRCIQKAFSQNNVIITRNPGRHCRGCPVFVNTKGMGSLTVKLENGGTLYGVLCGSLWHTALINDEEISLFNEVAADITFALRDIDLGYNNELLQQHRLRAAKMESIGTLAGGLAHDFNNLLTGIMGNIGMAKSLLIPGTDIYDMLDEAEKASIRSRDLTQQFLTFAKGGKPIKKVTVLTKVIKDSASFALRGSKISLELNLPEGLWKVEADEGQIGQVIHNLVINAQEAMPDGGKLTISGKNIKLKDPDKLPPPPGNYVQIDVTDTGCGIAPENLQKIFEPYFTTKQQGSGLGLTSAYSIIKSHGGSLLVESGMGQGSTFHIFLPASRKTAKGEEKVVTKQPSPAGGKVLIMDDDEIIRKMLKNMLALAGYETETTADGAEAIVKYRRAMDTNKPFTAVIMDLTVPGGIGGKEAIKKILEIDPEASVIASSGYATDAIMSEYKKYGFSAVIAKPYSVKQLQETLAGLEIDKKK